MSTEAVTRVVSAAIVREDEDPGSLLKRKTKRILLAQRLPPSIVENPDYPIPDPLQHIGGIGWFTANELKHLAFVGMLAQADNANVGALCATLEAP